MKEITIISPVKTPQDIYDFTKAVKCRDFYVYHHKFTNKNFEFVNDYIEAARACNSTIFVNFKHSILEEDLPQIKKFIEFLTTTKIDGIFVNSYGVLEIIKTMDLNFKVAIDSYFDIHNICGVEFMEMFHKIDKLIITEEIYTKNLEKIRRYIKIPLSVDSDNLPWFAEDIINSKAVSDVIIKGKFETSKDILNAIKLVEKILEKPKLFKDQKLPFKHVRKSFYKTNHFSGEMMSAKGRDFKFAKHIKKYDWETPTLEFDENFEYSKLDLPKLNLRLASLEQLKEVGEFIEKYKFNPVNSIEYGEVASTVDLSKKSFDRIVLDVKEFCKKHKISLNLSTPRILIERDFDRVYEANKALALQDPKPQSIVVNNIGFWWAILNDKQLQDTQVDIGGGINLLNSLAIKCLSNLNPIRAIDFSTLGGIATIQEEGILHKLVLDEENIVKTLKKTRRFVQTKKMFIGGCLRVESLGLCSFKLRQRRCIKAFLLSALPQGALVLKDPSLDKILPFVVDGFCKMHMFENVIVQNFEQIPYYRELGIDEFIIDFSAIHSPLIPDVLRNYLAVLKKIYENDAA